MCTARCAVGPISTKTASYKRAASAHCGDSSCHREADNGGEVTDGTLSSEKHRTHTVLTNSASAAIVRPMTFQQRENGEGLVSSKAVRLLSQFFCVQNLAINMRAP